MIFLYLLSLDDFKLYFQDKILIYNFIYLKNMKLLFILTGYQNYSHPKKKELYEVRIYGLIIIR